MLLSKACKEVLEGVLLFMVHQYGHLSSVATRKLQPRAFLTVFTEETAEISTWSVRVDASDLCVYFLDGKIFLNKLCGHGSCLKAILDTPLVGGGGGGERGRVVVLSRRIGEYTTVQQHSAVCLTGGSSDSASSDVVVEETVVPRPSDFPPSGLRVCFKGRCALRDMKKEADSLYVHIHYLHLINPDIEFGLLVKADRAVLVTSQWPRETGWHPLPTSSHTITTSIHHYTSAATKQSKLRLSRGASFTLQPLPLRSGSQLSLRLYCCAGVVPHLSLRRRRRVPANKTCRQLQVFVFGPGCLPVASPGSLTSLSLTSLADWENYGLSLTQTAENPEGGVVSSGWCSLSNNRPVVHSDRQSRTGCDRSLIVFVFLEDASTSRDRGSVGHCTTHYWGKQMERVRELREMLDGLLQSQQRKFKQATHSVLNKLLCNYGSHIKTASTLHSTIPLLADAVTSIIRNSSNNHFKQKCRDILGLPTDSEAEKESISERLWEIAEKQLQISKTQTNFPQEPTSPELIQAASGNSPFSPPPPPPPPLPPPPPPPSSPPPPPPPPSRPPPPPLTATAAPILNNHQTISTCAHHTALYGGDDALEPGGGKETERRENSRKQSSEGVADSRKCSLFEAMINCKWTKRMTTSTAQDTCPTSSRALPVTTPCPSNSQTESSSFDALAELMEETSNPGSASSATLSSAVYTSPTTHHDMQLNSATTTLALSGEDDTCFEDLAAVDADDECITFISQMPSSTRDGVPMTCQGGTRLQWDDDCTVDMDWRDDGEFDSFDAELSDFFTSANESEDEKGVTSGAEVKGGTAREWYTVKGCCEESSHTYHDRRATNSDWKQLGEVVECDKEQQGQLALVKPATQQESASPERVPSDTIMTSLRTITSHTVPDISHYSPTMDISGADFLWD